MRIRGARLKPAEISSGVSALGSTGGMVSFGGGVSCRGSLMSGLVDGLGSRKGKSQPHGTLCQSRTLARPELLIGVS